MKIKIDTDAFNDRSLLLDLFVTAVGVYKRYAVDASFDDRLKEQFVRQADRGTVLTTQLLHQKELRSTEFVLDEGEADRWHLLNMLNTGIDILRHAVADVSNLTAKEHFNARLARVEKLYSAIEDA